MVGYYCYNVWHISLMMKMMKAVLTRTLEFHKATLLSLFVPLQMPYTEASAMDSEPIVFAV
jgi:hypothetical protein